MSRNRFDAHYEHNPRFKAAVDAALKRDAAAEAKRGTKPAVIQAQERAQVEAKKPKRSKYGAVKVHVPDERTFDSKWEHTLWTRLRLEWEDGRTKWVWRQFQIPLPGNITMRLDFALVEQVEGQLVVRRLIDAKGMEPTRDWVNKRKQVEAMYGLTIEEKRR